MNDWLSERRSRVEEIRARLGNYYGWETSGEYVLAKDELHAKASVDLIYLIGEYYVMYRVLRELARFGREYIEEGLNLRYYDYLSGDAKELLGVARNDDATNEIDAE